jgi:hypothetical protein
MHITELILKTASIPKTKLFYNRTLELPIVSEKENTISFKAGKTILTFEAAADQKPFYHIAFNITNNKFSDSFEWINSKLDILPAGELPIAVYPAWNAESFYFYDNNGSILEFIVRFDLTYHSAQPFSVNDITEVSEIGIVTDNVPEAAKKLSEQHKQLPYYKNGPDLPDFSVLGDDNGLLILSQKGRAWVPTNKQSLIFPLTVKVDNIPVWKVD